MEERRANPRLRSLKGGLILFGTAPTVDCVIRNMSSAGALLVVNPVGIPDKITLVIKPEMIKHSCQVIWRSVDKIGVRFIQPAKISPVTGFRNRETSRKMEDL